MKSKKCIDANTIINTIEGLIPIKDIKPEGVIIGVNENDKEINSFKYVVHINDKIDDNEISNLEIK